MVKNKPYMKGKKIYILLASALIILFSAFKKDYFEVSKQLDIFTTLFKEISIYYVDDTNPDELMNTAIVSMLKTLDPYTNFYNENETESFKINVSGEYAGIGVSIAKIDEDIVITEIYDGFSADRAKLRIGDVILQIDDVVMDVNKPQKLISDVLKGSVGSELTLKIKRAGVNKTINVVLKREKVKIKAVPYYAILSDNVGYIYLSSFSKKAHEEVSNAFDSLKAKGMKSLIFDLRGNPGGLLLQAVDIVNLFVDEKTLVVETKGKIKDWNKKHFTKFQPKDKNIPIVVLTDNNSASASEIVAGTLQDLDRAVIMGARTFGKGLVQQPRELIYGTQLKLTIAKYYIPSGRCIQARDYFHKNADGTAKTIPDSLRHKFTTKAGRTVFDGAGIEPDVLLYDEYTSKIIQSIEKQKMFFKYAIDFSNSNDSVNINNFELDDKKLYDFKKYLDNDNFVYESELNKKLTEIEAISKENNIYPKLEATINNLKAEIKKQGDNAFEKNKKLIRKILQINIVNNQYHGKEKFTYKTLADKWIIEAKSILINNKKYNEILN